jgi:hypothetical protein
MEAVGDGVPPSSTVRTSDDEIADQAPETQLDRLQTVANVFVGGVHDVSSLYFGLGMFAHTRSR